MSGHYGPQPLNWLIEPTQWLSYPRNSVSSPTSPPPLRMFINAVYYPNWRIYRQQPPSSLRLDCISYIFYAFASVQQDGTVCFSNEWADTQIEVDGQKGCVAACVALKRRNGLLKVVLSVGGGGKGSDNFSAAARDEASRIRFAHSARNLVIEHNLDGIDINWEHPSNADEGGAYVELLTILRRYLPSPRFTITSALPGGSWALQHIDLARATHYLDLVNLMAYDFFGPWTTTAGHHAQLCAAPTTIITGSPSASSPSSAQEHLSTSSSLSSPPSTPAPSVTSAVAHLTAHGVPPSKILLGIPVYGRSFRGAPGPGRPHAGHHPGAESDGTFDYAALPLPGTRENVDEASGAAYCVPVETRRGTVEALGDRDGECAKHAAEEGFISYDNAATVRMKARFVKDTELAGLFYWHGPADSPDGERSLVLNGFEGLLPT